MKKIAPEFLRKEFPCRDCPGVPAWVRVRLPWWSLTGPDSSQLLKTTVGQVCPNRSCMYARSVAFKVYARICEVGPCRVFQGTGWLAFLPKLLGICVSDMLGA